MSGTGDEHAAAELRRAYMEGPIPSARVLMAADDPDAAYAVQEINTRFWTQSGRRVVGRKIGLTSRAVQQQLGVDQPDFGILFADMEVPSGSATATGRLLQPRVEAEVAFVIGRELPNPDLTTAEVARSIEYALAAIEIVDSRIAGWKITLADTIADNASSGLYVIGAEPRRLDQLDLSLCGMVLWKNGELVSQGCGAACLGHPLNAVTWLARIMARKGRPLAAGDVILSGALGPMVGVAKGDVVQAEIGGLGSVRTHFI